MSAADTYSPNRSAVNRFRAIHVSFSDPKPIAQTGGILGGRVTSLSSFTTPFPSC